MKRVNPKYAWREWLVAPAYQELKKEITASSETYKRY